MAGRATYRFLWTWRDVLRAASAYDVTTQHLHNLLARGGVPSPEGLHLRERAVQTGLEAYAER